MCFGLDFNWLVATGIWLVITVIKGGWHININL
jgi:hypothetical protein